ncbi:hypothetical protein C8Q77DRAFT_1154286 [Trametes polyzona]|nr:hypothetical protein C8Q77DRAFT_1154286 [Trametes polyzona]
MELLDLTSLKSAHDISARFEVLARELLHNHRIEVAREGKPSESLELLELEFYLYASDVHEDPFTHASAEQSQAGRWYFHRPPWRTNDPTSSSVGPMGYRGGTRKGLDITIGQPPAAIASKYFGHTSTQAASSSGSQSSILRGGILLRSIRRTSDSKVISGPSLLVDEVLRLNGAKDIAELVGANWDGDISAFPPSSRPASRASTMYLRRVAPTATTPPASSSCSGNDPKPRISHSPRIGLDISHPSIPAASALDHPRVHFIARPYRFFTHPHLLTANGRGQTFLGVHDALAEGAHRTTDTELLAELVKLTGVKPPTAAKYLDALKGGLEGGEIKQWIGPKGKTVLSSITAWLAMQGTLRRLRPSQSATAGSSMNPV